MKDRIVIETKYFSLVTDVLMKASIYPERNKGVSEKVKGDRAHLSAMTDESTPMETTINLERNKDLNESLLNDRIYFSGTE